MGAGGIDSRKRKPKRVKIVIGVSLFRLGKIEKDDDRRIANRGIVTREFQASRFAVHFKYGNVIAALIAAVQELAAGIEVETARIVAACPFVSDPGEFTGGAH